MPYSAPVSALRCLLAALLLIEGCAGSPSPGLGLPAKGGAAAADTSSRTQGRPPTAGRPSSGARPPTPAPPGEHAKPPVLGCCESDTTSAAPAPADTSGAAAPQPGPDKTPGPDTMHLPLPTHGGGGVVDHGGRVVIGRPPAGDTALPPVDTVISDQLRGLRPGMFQLRAQKRMVQGTPEIVSLRIAKDTVMPAATPAPNEVVRTKPTQVGDSAMACLEGGEDFEIHHTPGGEKCYTQLVVRGTDNLWEWLVTPKNPGDRLMLVASVRVLLARLPGKTVYRDSIAVSVTVKPCPLYRLSCVGEWLTTLRGGLTALGGIGTLLLGWFTWLRPRLKRQTT